MVVVSWPLSVLVPRFTASSGANNVFSGRAKMQLQRYPYRVQVFLPLELQSVPELQTVAEALD
jgi:hypothetical protein